MGAEPDLPRLDRLIDDAKARLDDLEAELETGRTRVPETIETLRSRVEALRGAEPDAEPTRAERLRDAMDALRAAVESELEAGSDRLADVLADLDGQIDRLEERFRTR
jgi:chromosome segregation ATPase